MAKEESIKFVATLLLEYACQPLSSQVVRNEIAAYLLDSLADEVAEELTERLARLEDVPLITLRDRLQGRGKFYTGRAETTPDDFAHLTTKCMFEGRAQAFNEAYGMADELVKVEAERCRAALKAGIAKFFDEQPEGSGGE